MYQKVLCIETIFVLELTVVLIIVQMQTNLFAMIWKKVFSVKTLFIQHHVKCRKQYDRDIYKDKDKDLMLMYVVLFETYEKEHDIKLISGKV